MRIKGLIILAVLSATVLLAGGAAAEKDCRCECPPHTEEPKPLEGASFPLTYLELGVGPKYSTPSLFFPKLELGLGYQYELIGVFGGMDFIPNGAWKTDGVMFKLYGFTGKFALRFAFHRWRERWLAAEVAGLWQYLFLKRADIPNMKDIEWADYGLGAYLLFANHISRAAGFYARAGFEYFPSGRPFRITAETTRSINSFAVMISVGVNFRFLRNAPP